MRARFPQLVYSILLVWVSTLMMEPVLAQGVVSEATYRRLNEVQKLIEDNKVREALERLDQIRVPASRRYESALLLQTYGYLYAESERYSEAVDALLQCLELNALSRPATKNTLYVVAQLQVSNQQYAAALESLEKWFSLEAAPSADAHALAGWVNARLERYQEAIEHLQQAISMQGQAKELWYQQLLTLYYDTQRLGDAAELLQQMVVLFPDQKKYWLNLSGIYQTLEQDERALALMELAYKQGMLKDELDLIRLAHYYMYMKAPLKAADLLRSALDRGAVASNRKNWLLLSEAWLGAKEMDRSLEALQNALEEQPSAELSLRYAQIASQMDDWNRVIRALEDIERFDGEPEYGASNLLLGIAHYNQQNHGAAIAALERAKTDPSVRGRAEQWRSLAVSEASPERLGR